MDIHSVAIVKKWSCNLLKNIVHHESIKQALEWGLKNSLAVMRERMQIFTKEKYIM